MFKLLKIKKINLLYFILAVIFGAVCSFYRFGLSLAGVMLFLSLGLFAYVSVLDLRDMEIDWRILIIGLISGLIILLFTSTITIYSIAGPILCALIPFILVSASREKWMGWGDVLIALWAGALVGYPASLIAIFFAFLLGSLSGIILLKSERSQSSAFAFGPYLLLGCLYSIILSDRIILLLGGL